jgi:NAD(P)-dependent dehydrogenase (short-subunit alcohol dehydrogenase family)
MRFTDKTAIVTGAGSGIGRAIACRLATECADIAIADINLEGAEETATQVRQLGRKACVVATDVADVTSVQTAISKTIDALGHIDILVNNAGINIRAPAHEMTDDQWHQVINVNLHGVWYFCRYMLPHFFERGGGNIVNIASIGAVEASHDRVPYMASKGAVASMSRALAIDLAERNIRVNAVSPGMTASNLATPELQKEMDAVTKVYTPMRRWAKSEEIAAAVAFLASDDASYITGHVLTVDGGMTAGNRIGRALPPPDSPESW